MSKPWKLVAITVGYVFISLGFNKLIGFTEPDGWQRLVYWLPAYFFGLAVGIVNWQKSGS